MPDISQELNAIRERDAQVFEWRLIEALRNPSPELLSALAEAQFQAHVRSARSSGSEQVSKSPGKP
jgi:hypothetical protein